MTDPTSPVDVVERLEAALAEVEPWDGGRVIQVGLGNYDSKRMDLSLSDLRAAAALIRELEGREKAAPKEVVAAACDAHLDAFVEQAAPRLKKVTDQLYYDLLEGVQEYLKENANWNLTQELRNARDLQTEHYRLKRQHSDMAEEVGFLVARLTDFENDGDARTDDGERDWHGHVSPSLSRLRKLLAPASPTQENA